MTKKQKPARRIYTLAAAIGLALGAMGVAGAATSGSTTTTAPPEPAVSTADESTVPEVSEIPSDEATDGIDHQFVGEEVGNNGDGIADANEASEVEAPADEGAEVESATDAATDGIDFQQEGQNVGDNGGPAQGPDDVINGPDDAAEASTTG